MSCDNLKIYVDGLINSGDVKDIKRGNMISEWVGRYVKLLKIESKNVTAYKYDRGSVLKVNFGFRVGSEFGGVHYCVVVNCSDNPYSRTLIVVPMSSYKGSNDGEDVRISQVYIGSELKDALLEHMNAESDSIIEALKVKNSDSPKSKEEEEQLQKKLNRVLGEMEELRYMKDKSVILVDQIITISKHRVIFPKNSYDVMSKIKLSPGTLDRLNNKIVEFIIGEKRI